MMMSMSELINLLPAFVAGIVLGTVFFGGLWLTVKHGLRKKKSVLIFTASFIIRMTIILLGFYYVGANSWQKMLVCLLGFLMARFVITRITAGPDADTEIAKEVSDET